VQLVYRGVPVFGVVKRGQSAAAVSDSFIAYKHHMDGRAAVAASKRSVHAIGLQDAHSQKTLAHSGSPLMTQFSIMPSSATTSTSEMIPSSIYLSHPPKPPSHYATGGISSHVATRSGL
jgi:hypothetical protein